jgi:hypothetical protein
LILALIALVSGIALWTGLRFLSRAVRVQVGETSEGKKEVSIKTPVFSLEAGEEVNEARLGLPIYPGAQRVKDHESATVNIEVPGEQGVRVVAAKFETSDAFEKVRDFYQDRLRGEVPKVSERTPEGETVFEIKREGQEKIVALRSVGARTRIQLVRVSHGRGTTN